VSIQDAIFANFNAIVVLKILFSDYVVYNYIPQREYSWITWYLRAMI